MEVNGRTLTAKDYVIGGAGLIAYHLYRFAYLAWMLRPWRP